MLALRFALAFAPAAWAGEGMWTPDALPLAELAAQGFDAEALADLSGGPLAAVVSLGGCSGSFVSAQGLVITNHHCVSDYLQAVSDAEHNRARDGYLARSAEEELWGGPTARVQVVESVTDITAEVMRGAPTGDDAALSAHVERRRNAAVDACERTGRVCEAASFDGGATVRLTRYREYPDVRLVYAPPESVGSYGGELDNWMWPRHAGDFALLRVYVAPDQSPAEHSPANVPYQPPRHLRLAREPLSDGDRVAAMGFPGSTRRWESADTLRFELTERLPPNLTLAEEVLGDLRALALADPEAAARLASPIDGWANHLKYLQGLRDNEAAFGVLARKTALWAQVEAALGSPDPAGSGLAGSGRAGSGRADSELALARTAFAELDAVDRREQRGLLALDLVETLLESELLSAAHTVWRLALERQKPDARREEGLRRRDEPWILDALEAMDQSLWLPAERALLARTLTRHQQLPPEQRIAPLDTWVQAQGGLDAALDRLMQDPVWAQPARRRHLAQVDLRRLSALDDPFLGLAQALEAWLAPLRAQQREAEGARLRLRPVVMHTLRTTVGAGTYPDANSTLRLTYGRVQGYSPADGVYYTPFTTLAGLLAKRGPAPFDAPERLVEAALKARPAPGAVPVNFLTDLDTTGGNSGSPVINPRGELVGLVFDGNYESMTADWLFDAERTRTICVDLRYVLWVLAEAEQAGHLVRELGG